jgi:hypothetical protein
MDKWFLDWFAQPEHGLNRSLGNRVKSGSVTEDDATRSGLNVPRRNEGTNKMEDHVLGALQGMIDALTEVTARDDGRMK